MHIIDIESEDNRPTMSTCDSQDLCKQFELSLPFSKTYIKLFVSNLDKITEICGNEGFVTLEALADHIATPAWEPLTR